MDLYNGLFNVISGGGGEPQPVNYGRFLSLWDCSTGLPLTDPDESPYEYKTGDYFIVDVVAEEGNNYRPDGTSFVIGQASTVVETKEVSIGDTYWFDGENWLLQLNHQVAPGVVWEVVWDEDSGELASGPTYEEIITIRDNSLPGTRLALHAINENGYLIGEFEYQGVARSANFEPDENYPIFFLNVSVPSMMLYFQVFKITAEDTWSFVSRDSGEGVAEAGHADSADNATNASYAQKVGTSSFHPSIGSESQPVYVNSDGKVVASNRKVPKTVEWTVTLTANGTIISVPTFNELSTRLSLFEPGDIYKINLVYTNNPGTVDIGKATMFYDEKNSNASQKVFFGVAKIADIWKLIAVLVDSSDNWTITPYTSTNYGEIYSKKAETADAYSNGAVGSAAQPIYLDANGTPQQGNTIPAATTWEVKAKVNGTFISGPTFATMSAAINSAASVDTFHLHLLYRNNGDIATVCEGLLEYAPERSGSTNLVYTGIIRGILGNIFVIASVTNQDSWTITGASGSGEFLARDADSAKAYASGAVGSATQPVYLDAQGVPVAGNSIVGNSSQITLLSTDWAQDSTYGAYAQTVNVSWMTTTSNIMVSPVLPATKLNRDLTIAAQVACVEQGNGTLTFIANSSSVPTLDITMNVKELL